MKIIAVVKFNQGEALVFDELPELVYTKYGPSTIVGKSGIFSSCYGKAFDPGAKAFGGRKFDLQLTDGTVEHCDGQWWSSVTTQALSALGVSDDNPLVSVTAKTLDELKKCYVFHGYTSTRKEYQDLRGTYTGPVYEYHEYEKIVRNLKTVDTDENEGPVAIDPDDPDAPWNFRK